MSDLRLKILVSAFACVPNAGSEGGVGWYWAHEWARDHDVLVLTDTTRRAAIEAEEQRNPSPPGLKFIYFRPSWLRWMPLNSWTAQVLFQLWQLGAVSFVRKLHGDARIDLLHHVTYGVFRHPSLLGRVGVPLVFGPVGGGEDAPWALKRSMPRRDRVREALRSLINRWARYDPLLRHGLHHTALILVKTRFTAQALPPGFEHKTRVALEIGSVPRVGVLPKPPGRQGRLQLVYAGNLIGLKGVHLGLAALAHACQLGADVGLTVIGAGPMQAQLLAQAQALGLGERVRWLGRLPQAELMASYLQFDALLFPSLHDSSGNVVVEALSFGLPVVCFELGGPAEIVNSQCGIVVPVAGHTEASLTTVLGQELLELAQEPNLLHELSCGALKRSHELQWTTQAQRIKGWSLSLVGATDQTNSV